jgi:hypothetical protein
MNNGIYVAIARVDRHAFTYWTGVELSEDQWYDFLPYLEEELHEAVANFIIEAGYTAQKIEQLINEEEN